MTLHSINKKWQRPDLPYSHTDLLSIGTKGAEVAVAHADVVLTHRTGLVTPLTKVSRYVSEGTGLKY